jgi:ABC-2 type transport system permease protein/sodium transport system permease protein
MDDTDCYRRHPSLGRFVRLCQKELREILRDRRTILTLLLMPLLVYPLLSIGFQRLLLNTLESTSHLQCRIALASEYDATRVKRYLELGGVLLKQQTGAADDRVSPEQQRTPGVSGEPLLEIDWFTTGNLKQQVTSGVVDLAIIVHDAPSVEERVDLTAPLRCEVIYRENSALSKAALDHLQQRFRAVNDAYLQQQLIKLGAELDLPTRVANRPVGGSGAAFSLTTLIPLVLILMTITGAVYPAIDLTAGERERGTLEALMAAPVPRLSLLAAKYVAVVTVALLTAGANLLAMTITLLTTGLGKILFGQSGLSPLVMFQVFALLVLFAGFFSAVLLAVTSFARSFKEAQAYLIPLMLLSLAPALISVVPGVKFDALLAVTPLVNIVLLARDLFEGGVDPKPATVAVLSTILYALAAIGLAARTFGTDAILYGSQATWSDLFRRPAGGRRQPSVSGAMLLLAVLFPCYFLTTGILAQLDYDSPSTWMVLSGVATVVLFGGFPLIAAVLQGAPRRDAFQLYPARPLAWIGAPLLGLSLWPMAHEIFLLNETIGLATLSEERIESARQLLESWHAVSPLLVLAALAFAPAVCEELLFRGYLMRALLAAASPRKAILISAVLFGLFHVLATNVLMTERLLPSTFLGLILGWVCWRSGSVLPGMLLHACHNGLLLLLVYYKDELMQRGWGMQEQSHMPPGWLAGAALGLVVGLTLVWFAGPANRIVSAKEPAN